MSNSIHLRMGALAILAALPSGCRRPPPPPSPTPSLTPAQQTAVLHYAALLDLQIDKVDETAAILAKVQLTKVAKDAARVELVQLSLAMDSLLRRIREESPSDPQVIAAARTRVAARQQAAAQKLREQIRSINKMEGGPDFFEKELRPVLPTLQGR